MTQFRPRFRCVIGFVVGTKNHLIAVGYEPRKSSLRAVSVYSQELRDTSVSLGDAGKPDGLAV